MAENIPEKDVQALLQALGAAASAEKPRRVTLTSANLSVTAPDTGPTMVKTLPRAIINTFGYDQMQWIRRNIHGLPIRSAPSKQKTLLHDISAIVKPGEMLLVLGRPGSGCSTFLRTAANRSTLSVKGDLRFAAIPHTQFYKDHRRDTIYLPEEDNHIASLTVRQTLEFALRMNLAERTTSQAIPVLATALAAMFGLENVLDTPVGGGAIPGISGGERKRVSIAEILAAGSSLQCFDNSTKGLDSSTALDFVKALRTLTDVAQKTTLATLYQAGENVYRAFDKVLVLDQGREVFFGPISTAKEHFEGLGFICTPGQTTAEFLTGVTDPLLRRTHDGTPAAAMRTPDDIALAFRNSSPYAHLQAELETYRNLRTEPQLTPSSPINLSYPVQIYECLRREFQLVNGKRRVQYQKWINTIILCLIVGSEYFSVSNNTLGVFTREGIVFYAIIANAWMQYPELFDAHANRPVLERQSSLNMYRPSAVAVARIIIDLPLIAIQHAWFMLAFYFLTHHSVKYTVGDFFYFYLVLWLSTLSFANLLRMFAYYVPSVEDCFRFGGIASTTTVYFAGFLIPINKMKPVWSWLHYISPPRYTYEALITNDFRAVNIACANTLLPQTTNANASHQVCPIRGARAGQIIVPGLQYVESFGFSYSHKWRNVGILIAFCAAYMLVGIVGSELLHFSAQGGSPIVFASRKDDNNRSKPVLETDIESSAAMDADRIEKKAEDFINATNHTSPSLVWKNLEVRLGEKKLLNGISGYVRPGDLVALCGASGAGKTTLLTHLSQTNGAGLLDGDIRFGARALGTYFKKVSGFAQQSDLHDGTATIREAFEFSALLRQPSTYSRREKLRHIDHVLNVLDLVHLQHAVIESGLGVELSRRVTIGVELAARPKILFADEPTSGLDSQGAATIISYLRRLSKAGQAIVVTVHQPSASLFRLFDKLLLLSSNGEQVYFGSVRGILPYFETYGTKAPQDVNPAEFVLDVVGAGIHGKTSTSASNWVDIWRQSSQAKQIDEEISRIETESFAWDDAETSLNFNASVLLQVAVVTRRMLLNQWRKPAYVYSKIWVHIIQAILIGFTFFNLGTSPLDLQSRAFGAFALIFLVNTIVNPILARFFGNRLLWQAREGPSRAYGWFALCTSSILAEIPAIVLTGTVYFLLWYFLTGLPLGEKAIYTFLMVMTYEIFEMTFGLLVTAVSPDLKFAGLLLVFLVTTFNWFNGVVVPFEEIQIAWRYWVYYLNPLTYLFGGLIIAANAGIEVICDTDDLYRFPPPPGQSCGDYAGKWARDAQANLTNPGATDECLMCPYISGNQYLTQFHLDNGMLANNIWAYWAVFGLFTISNVGFFYLFMWMKSVKKWKVFYFF